MLEKDVKEDILVHLVLGAVSYLGPTKMLEYTVTGMDLSVNLENQVILKVFLQRRVARHILTTYLPSVFVLTIAQVKRTFSFSIFM